MPRTLRDIVEEQSAKAAQAAAQLASQVQNQEPPPPPRSLNRRPMTFAEELKRKSVHIAALAIPIGYYFVPEHDGRLILLGMFVAFLIADIVRLQTPRLRAFMRSFLGDILRSHESRDLLAATYLIGGALLTTYAIRHKGAAIAALSFLIIGDTVAALIGRRFGRLHFFGKTVEGSLACFLSCLVVSAVMMRLPASHLDQPPLTWFALITGSIVATVFEALPIPIDDNFRIPLSSGIAMLTVLGLT